MKIKYSIIQKLNTLTAKEMDLFFYLVRRQNQEDGTVEGVYYRDVMRQAGMCRQSFYNALRGLEKKQAVTVTKISDMDYNVCIPGNAFPAREEYRKGYVNLNRQAFRSKKFQALKAHEKFMLLEFLKGTHENGHSLNMKTENLYEKFMKLLKVSKRVIRGYLHRLKQFFSIGVKDGKYYITYLHSVFHDRSGKAEENWYFEHLVKKECWRLHMAHDDEALEETARIAKQYRPYAGSTAGTLSLLMQCIRKSAEDTEPGNRQLHEKYVHKLMRQSLGLPCKNS